MWGLEASFSKYCERRVASLGGEAGGGLGIWISFLQPLFCQYGSGWSQILARNLAVESWLEGMTPLCILVGFRNLLEFLYLADFVTPPHQFLFCRAQEVCILKLASSHAPCCCNTLVCTSALCQSFNLNILEDCVFPEVTEFSWRHHGFLLLGREASKVTLRKLAFGFWLS